MSDIRPHVEQIQNLSEDIFLSAWQDQPLPPRLAECAGVLQQLMGSNLDFSLTRLQYGGATVALACLQGLVKPEFVRQTVLQPLESLLPANLEALAARLPLERPPRTVRKVGEVLAGILRGHAALFVDGEAGALLLDVTGFPKRSVEHPRDEPAIYASEEGLVETLLDNVALLRRSVPDPRLHAEGVTLGNMAHQHLAVLYVAGLARSSVVSEVRQRLLAGRSLRGALHNDYVIRLLADVPWSPFPQVLQTQRADRAAAALLSGRVVVLPDPRLTPT